MIIDRYLISEISKPLVAVCTILVVIFASYKAAEYLADAASGLFSGQTVLYLVLLKAVIALEVLVPTTLYLSVVIALGRLYTDSEMTALSACGVSVARIVKAVLYFSLPLAVLVGSLSLYVRPWAYEKRFALQEEAKATFHISRWKAGNFYTIPRMNRVIFAEEIDPKRNRAEQVFIQSEHGDSVQIIYAKEAYQHEANHRGKQVIVFLDGYLYEFSRIGEEGHIIKFEQSTLSLEPPETRPVGYKCKTVSTRKLVHSGNPEDIAELQWRLSTPISTMLLALLGVPLSRTAPRRGKYAKVVAAVFIYAVYYNVSAMAKNWVEQGVVGSVPGIWWVDGLLACLVLALYLQPTLSFRWRRMRQRLS